MSSKPLVDYFAERLQAREVGRHSKDYPYCAGSYERREWAAGFGARVAQEDDDGLNLDPNENSESGRRVAEACRCAQRDRLTIARQHALRLVLLGA